MPGEMWIPIDVQVAISLYCRGYFEKKKKKKNDKEDSAYSNILSKRAFVG